MAKNKQEAQDFIKGLELDEVMELPEEMRREVLKRQLSSGAGPLRFMMSRTPMGFLRQNVFNMAGKMLDSTVGNYRKLADRGITMEDIQKEVERQREIKRQITMAKLNLGAAVSKNMMIRQSNDRRYEARVQEANEAGEQAPRRTFMDVVIEQIIPGHIYAKSRYHGADQHGRPMTKKQAAKKAEEQRDR